MTQLILVIWRHSGIVDERMQRAVEKPFFLADKTSRSAVMRWVQFGSRLHSGGTASREQMMIPPAEGLDEVILSLFRLAHKLLTLERATSNTVNSSCEQNRHAIRAKTGN